MKKANRSKLAREKAGLTVKQAAALLHIEPDYLIVVEEMDVQLADFDFNKLAELYGCRVEWITGEVEQHDYASVDGISGSEKLTQHDRTVVAEFIAMMPRKPAKTLAQVAAERGHGTAGIELHGKERVQPLESWPEQFVVHCKCGWQSTPVATEEATADAMARHLVDVKAIS